MQKLFKSVSKHLPPLYRPVVFEPIASDGDELTRAIDNDVHAREDDWKLDETLDPTQLEAFWDSVLTELGPDKTADK